MIAHVSFLFCPSKLPILTNFKTPGLDKSVADTFAIFEMFGKTCLLIIFCFLVPSKAVSANDKAENASLKSVPDDKTPQLADQTININNCGLWRILWPRERNLLSDIKAKIDSLSDKGKVTLFEIKFRDKRLDSYVWI